MCVSPTKEVTVMPDDLPLASEFMTRELVTVHPETSAYDAIVLLLKHHISGMPVVDAEGRLVGILSEKDCLKTLVDAKYHDLPTASVKDLMSGTPQVVSPDTDILQVAEIFLRNRFRRLPVVDGDELVGQISRRDVLRSMEHLR